MKKKCIKNDFNKITYGIRKGVALALAQHKKAGNPIYVSDAAGKIKKIPPEEIVIPDEFKKFVDKIF